MLQPISLDASELAKNAARQILNQVSTTASNIVRLRKNGMPIVPAREEFKTPDGRVIPATEERPAVTGEQIDEALGEKNVAVLSELASALGL